MEALQMIQEALAKDKERQEKALAHLREALALLEDGAGTGLAVSLSSDGRAQVANWPPPRRGYIEALVGVLEANGNKAMSPAELRRELIKQPEFADVQREALDRALWGEIRKPNARIERVGEGMYQKVAQKKKKSA